MSSGDIVWNAYFDYHNEQEASTAVKLQAFSKRKSVPNITYKTARDTFNKNKGKGRVEINSTSPSTTISKTAVAEFHKKLNETEERAKDIKESQFVNKKKLSEYKKKLIEIQEQNKKEMAKPKKSSDQNPPPWVHRVACDGAQKAKDTSSANKKLNQQLEKKDRKIRDLQKKLDQKTKELSAYTNPHSIMNKFMGELKDLINVIAGHLDFMEKQKVKVNKVVKAYEDKTQSSQLSIARDNALKTQKELLQEIMSIPSMYKFLDKIILIENLFNSLYNAQQQEEQREARGKFGTNLSLYEKKNKPVCEVPNFVDLLFAGNVHLTSFEALVKELEQKCKQQHINIVQKSDAKAKKIERAFYKAFFVYNAQFGDQGFKRMTDVLRCSLVFDNFAHLYKCFGVIENTMRDKGGILRCKDRFNPAKVAFGYRDLLINVYC
eukprot:361273_1